MMTLIFRLFILIFVFSTFSIAAAESETTDYVDQSCADNLGMVFENQVIHENGLMSLEYNVVAGHPTREEVEECLLTPYFLIEVYSISAGSYQVRVTYKSAPILLPFKQLDVTLNYNLEFEDQFEIFNSLMWLIEGEVIKSEAKDYISIQSEYEGMICDSYYSLVDYDSETGKPVALVPLVTPDNMGEMGRFIFTFFGNDGEIYVYDQDVITVHGMYAIKQQFGFVFLPYFADDIEAVLDDSNSYRTPFPALSSEKFSGQNKPVVTYCSEIPYEFEVHTFEAHESFMIYDFEPIFMEESN